MLATVMRFPSNAFHVASRGTGTSLTRLGGLVTTAFPGLLMPADRVAFQAWALGHYAAPAPAVPALRAAVRTS